MKYLKLFEDNNDDYDKIMLEELCQDLKDRNFKVEVLKANNIINPIIFNDNFYINDNKDINIVYDTKLSGYLITIDKNYYHYTIVENNEFNLNEIRDNLLFIESYAEDELKLKLEYIQVIYSYLPDSADIYYKDAKYLKDINMHKILIAFSK